tara:strand:- start:651 stop:1079 length:429 start_codon:yes stop_codon:yes gene_type:complete
MDNVNNAGRRPASILPISTAHTGHVVITFPGVANSGKKKFTPAQAQLLADASGWGALQDFMRENAARLADLKLVYEHAISVIMTEKKISDAATKAGYGAYGLRGLAVKAYNARNKVSSAKVVATPEEQATAAKAAAERLANG